MENVYFLTTKIYSANNVCRSIQSQYIIYFLKNIILKHKKKTKFV